MHGALRPDDYKLGDTGPAGGIVFYDKGFASDGWRYLDAAPAGTEFTADWGWYETNVAGTGTEVGSGRRNTRLIAAALGANESAARLCANLNVNGYADWFSNLKFISHHLNLVFLRVLMAYIVFVLTSMYD